MSYYTPGFLVYHLVKLFLFWIIYLGKLDKIDSNENTSLKFITTMNIVDRELFFIPQMVVFCEGFR
jgi:hypothetical protein